MCIHIHIYMWEICAVVNLLNVIPCCYIYLLYSILLYSAISTESYDASITNAPRWHIARDGMFQSPVIYPHSDISSQAQDQTHDSHLAREDMQLQVRCLFQRATDSLQALGSSLADVVFVHLFVDSLNEEAFAAMNAEYENWFLSCYPPSRSTVQV